MKLFFEKIQNIRIFHNDDHKTPIAIAYDFPKFPSEIDCLIEINLLNIKANKEYVIAVKYITSSSPTALHLLNNVLLKVEIDDMIKIEDDYGLAFGTFTAILPIEESAEFEIEFELRALEDMTVILDTFRTYLVVGGKK